MQAIRHGLVAASSLAVLLSLAACGDNVDNAAQMEAQNMSAAEQVTTRVGQDRSNTEAASDASQLPQDGTTAMGAAGESGLVGDAKITMDVKTALAADPDLSAIKIDVDAQEGKVTLRGTAPDAPAKEKAAEIARTVPDVKAVDNLLTLG